MSAPLTPDHIEAATALGSLLSCDKPDDKDEMVAAYADLLRSDKATKRLSEWAYDEGDDPVAVKAREMLLPGLLAAESRYVQIPRQWPGVFWRCNSDQPYEQWNEVRRTGLAQIRRPGASAALDGDQGETIFQYRIEPHEVALSVRITAEKIRDGSYLREFPSVAFGLGDSFVATEEIIHANVLSAGMVYNPVIVGDGCPLFSETHSYARDGLYSNRGNFYLNEMALEEAKTRISSFSDAAGLRMFIRPKKLIVPLYMEFAAERLIKSMTKDESPALPREGYQVLDYLTDPKAWFLVTTFRGLMSVSQKRYRLSISIKGGDLLVEASQSYGAGHINPRGCFGSFPA